MINGRGEPLFITLNEWPLCAGSGQSAEIVCRLKPRPFEKRSSSHASPGIARDKCLQLRAKGRIAAVSTFPRHGRFPAHAARLRDIDDGGL